SRPVSWCCEVSHGGVMSSLSAINTAVGDTKLPPSSPPTSSPPNPTFPQVPPRALSLATTAIAAQRPPCSPTRSSTSTTPSTFCGRTAGAFLTTRRGSTRALTSVTTSCRLSPPTEDY